MLATPGQKVRLPPGALFIRGQDKKTDHKCHHFRRRSTINPHPSNPNPIGSGAVTVNWITPVALLVGPANEPPLIV